MRLAILTTLFAASAQAWVCSSHFPADQCEQWATYSWYCGPNADQYFGYCEMEANGEWGCECADSISTIGPASTTDAAAIPSAFTG